MTIKRYLFSLAAFGALAFGATVAACGGGGDDGGSTSPGGGSDETYVAAICTAGSQFVKDIAAAQRKAEKDVETASEADAEKIAAKAMSEPVANFAKNVKNAKAPKDVKSYHDELVSNLEKAAKGLKDGDISALESLTLKDAPEDVSARLDTLAAANKDCLAADFAFGE